MKVYIGCSLAHASDSLKAFVPDFKKRIAEAGYEVLEFLGEAAGTELEVYRHDLHCVQLADRMIAFVDEPSIGLGMELQEAMRLNKAILCLQTPDSYISRMLRGARDAGLLDLATFADLEEASNRAIHFLQTQ